MSVFSHFLAIIGFLAVLGSTILNVLPTQEQKDDNTNDDINRKKAEEAEEFLSKLDKEKLNKIKNSMDSLRRIKIKNLFEYFKLEKFATDKNPANVNVLRSSGEIDTNWTINHNGFIYPGIGSEGEGIWIFDANSPNGESKAQDLKWLTKSLDPSEHFKVHALIKFLNNEV